MSKELYYKVVSKLRETFLAIFVVIFYFTTGSHDQFYPKNIPPNALDVLLAKLVCRALGKVKFY